MNTRWKRIAKLNDYANIIHIRTNKSNEILMWDNQLNDDKCVAWADDFKKPTVSFRKHKTQYRHKRRYIKYENPELLEDNK